MPTEPAPSVQLLPPEKPAAPSPPADVAEDRSPTPSLPAGIPRFANVKPRISVGLKPDLDGWSWLQDKGYRAVLHLQQPGEDDSHRGVVESRGLKYLSLQVPPQPLTREVVDQFNRIVTDEANQPLFVYDRDGMLTGGLWYLYFRLVDNLPDEEAVARASRLGLSPDKNGEHRVMWVGIQQFLATQGK
jgi:protein tyrosine phosphatase (PTP) superfamily phosphohydrolase (DUF442 family)